MNVHVFQIRDRLTPDELRVAEESAKAQGLSLEEWLERAIKAAIYAGVSKRLLKGETAAA